MNARLLFIVGTIPWFLTAFGHSMLVDINLVLGLPGPLGPEVRPDGDQVRSMLIASTWDFGWMGLTTAHRAISGFSLWLPTSTLFLGLINVIIGLSRALPQVLFYRLTIINAAASVVFSVFAFICFIYPPLLNGVVSTVAFALAARSIAQGHRRDARD